MTPTPAREGSLADRITLLVLLTSATVILLVSAALAAANHVQVRDTAFQALRTQGRLATINAAAPLAFGDVDTGREVVNGFSALPDVSSATLFDTSGAVFARFTREGFAERLPLDTPAGENGALGVFVVSLPVGERQDQLGTLQVVYDLAGLRQLLLRNLLWAAGTCVVALLLSALAARKGARLLVRRLEWLDQTAHQVSRTRDYSLRAEVKGNDEVARFTETFNQMLGEIQRQDRDLRESRQQALAASRLKDEFLATVSHELRTPMTPITGWAQVLQRIAPDNPQVTDAARVIERSARAMTRIIDDLLDMSRIISGKIRLNPEPVVLEDVVRDAIGAVQVAADAKRILLATAVPAGLGLRADPHRLQQVLWNLLSNAVKFTPAGGVVRIEARTTADHVLVSVSDTGPGIDPGFLPYVFDRFRQADSSVTRPHGGLGLGLAIARQLVELHGGEIEAQSAGIGHGCCLTITLPRAASGDATAPATPGSSTLPEEPLGITGVPLTDVRVLSVEDNDDAREYLRHVFASHGAEVVSAASADEALARLERFQPHVLVSDIGMPGRDGYWLIGQVREHANPALRGLPAIALTAFAGEADRERAIDAGYNAHVAKPATHEALVSAVRLVLPTV
ncbi:ATP-binding protein [Lysobacter sp. A3-1-A15]|uniref:ATP-binding protein n=1 Tax=Novilysobacter viscosus TaxID=3098602 RepID=UPI002EDA3F74